MASRGRQNSDDNHNYNHNHNDIGYNNYDYDYDNDDYDNDDYDYNYNSRFGRQQEPYVNSNNNNHPRTREQQQQQQQQGQQQGQPGGRGSMRRQASSGLVTPHLRPSQNEGEAAPTAITTATATATATTRTQAQAQAYVPPYVPTAAPALRGLDQSVDRDDDGTASVQPPSRPTASPMHKTTTTTTMTTTAEAKQQQLPRRRKPHASESDDFKLHNQPNPPRQQQQPQQKQQQKQYKTGYIPQRDNMPFVPEQQQQQQQQQQQHFQRGNNNYGGGGGGGGGCNDDDEHNSPIYLPPQQRTRPLPEDRAPPRYDSFHRNFPNNPYSVASTQSLGPMPASSKNVHCNGDTLAVDSVLYNVASVVIDGPMPDQDTPPPNGFLSNRSRGVGWDNRPTTTTTTTTNANANNATTKTAQSTHNDHGNDDFIIYDNATTTNNDDVPQLVSPSRGPSIPARVRSRRQSGVTTDSENIYNGEFLDDFDFALFELSELCASSGKLELNGQHTEQDYIEHDLSWNPVREWLQTHSLDHTFPYLQARDEYGKTALHFACQHQPPMDIMEYLMQVIISNNAPESLASQDAFGWTPLHYACAFAAPTAVLLSLAQNRPDAKLMITNKGLTPLHLALIGPIRDVPDIIAILGSNGANKLADQQGLLPVHYACAFGASEESLRVLIDSYPQALTTKDNFGRNPLHFALANTKTNPKAAPVTVRLLLKLRPALVNPSPDDDGPNPFLFLLEYATQINVGHPSVELRESIKKCLLLLLDADPNPTPTVFTALRSLPYWLFPTAILSKTVQKLLNQKMKGRFPTIILMMDFFVQVITLIFYQYSVVEALKVRYQLSSEEGQRQLMRGDASLQLPFSYIFPLLIGGTYFFLREVVQVFSLIYLKSFKTFLRAWILHLTDWLDLGYIAVVYSWAAIMKMGSVPDVHAFSTGTAVCASVLWGKLFIYLRSASFDFSIFVSGIFHVAGRLVPYIVGLCFFFLAFMQIFHSIYASDEYYGCLNPDREELTTKDMQCGDFDDFLPFCTHWSAFLRVYTMFIGEVDNDQFKTSVIGTVFFSFFMFLMVILLANVLIAIVTDSYKVIQDREATLVFYTNRLYFLAETDAISNVPCFRLFHSADGDIDESFRNAWQTLFYQFELGPGETIGTSQFWKFRFIPLVIASFIIPLWFLSGFLTFGAIWPPQLREWLFSVNEEQKNTIGKRHEDEQSARRQEESQVEAQVDQTRQDFYQSLAENRQQLSQIKASVAERKQEIRKEMRRIKILVNNLLEQAEVSDDDDYDD